MEFLGIGVLAVVLLVGAVLLSRMMGRSDRNDGGRHGGGTGGMTDYM